MTAFRDAFLVARRRIDAGADPEEVVPALLQAAEAQEEIDLASHLYDDDVTAGSDPAVTEDGDGES